MFNKICIDAKCATYLALAPQLQKNSFEIYLDTLILHSPYFFVNDFPLDSSKRRE